MLSFPGDPALDPLAYEVQASSDLGANDWTTVARRFLRLRVTRPYGFQSDAEKPGPGNPGRASCRSTVAERLTGR